MKTFEKYKQNLSLVVIEGVTYVKSYNTLVARIELDKLVILGWWSQTTSKHINYAAQQLGLSVTK
jgi:hypothetical protein